MKNKFYYEDEPLNESLKKEVGRTLGDVIVGGVKAVGGVASKALGHSVVPATKALVPGVGTYKPGTAGRTAQSIGSILTGTKKTTTVTGPAAHQIVKTTTDPISRSQAAKDLAKDVLLMKNRTTLGKVKAGVVVPALAGSAYYDNKYNEGKQTKRTTGALKSAGKSGIDIAKGIPETVGAITNIGAVTVATLASTIAGVQKSFNVLYAKSDCYSNPNSEPCLKLIREKNEAIRKAKEKAAADKAAREPRSPTQQKIDSLKELPAKASEKLATYSKAQKTAAGIGAVAVGLTAAAVAAKAIKDSFEKKDWYNKKCARIENPEQKEKCQEYVYKRTMKELQSKLSRCKLANNPQKCVDMITAKIQEINKKSS